MSASELENRAARVCVALGEEGFRDVVAAAGATDVLDRVLSALRAEGPAERLSEDLDLLDHRLARIGVDGLTTGDRGYRPVPGAAGHPVVEVWVCPTGRCGRMAGRSPQRCAVTDRPFNLVRLPT